MDKRIFVAYILIQYVLLHGFVSATKINGLHAYYNKGKSVNAIIAAKLEKTTAETADHGNQYKIGFGIGDITGPSAEINMVNIEYIW